MICNSTDLCSLQFENTNGTHLNKAKQMASMHIIVMSIVQRIQHQPQFHLFLHSSLVCWSQYSCCELVESVFLLFGVTVGALVVGVVVLRVGVGYSLNLVLNGISNANISGLIPDPN